MTKEKKLLSVYLYFDQTRIAAFISGESETQQVSPTKLDKNMKRNNQSFIYKHNINYILYIIYYIKYYIY